MSFCNTILIKIHQNIILNFVIIWQSIVWCQGNYYTELFCALFLLAATWWYDFSLLMSETENVLGTVILSFYFLHGKVCRNGPSQECGQGRVSGVLESAFLGRQSLWNMRLYLPNQQGKHIYRYSITACSAWFQNDTFMILCAFAHWQLLIVLFSQSNKKRWNSPLVKSLRTPLELFSLAQIARVYEYNRLVS